MKSKRYGTGNHENLPGSLSGVESMKNNGNKADFKFVNAKQEAFFRQQLAEIERLKKSERELEINNLHLKHLIENTGDVITVLNYNGHIRYQNPASILIHGYQPDELLNTDIFTHIHPDDADAVRGKLASVIRTVGNLVSAEFRYRHKNGTWRYLESIAKNIVDPKDGPGVLVNSRDITDRVETLKKLEYNEKQLSHAQHVGKMGSWEWDIVQNRITWSDELCKIFGVTTETYPKTFEGYLQLLHPDDRKRTQQILMDALENRSEYGFEHRIIRPDGQILTLCGRGEIRTDEMGEPVSMLGTGQDITEIKQAEQKLRIYSRQLKKLTARQEKIRESERIRIARDIHDELGQMLTVLKIDVFMAFKAIQNEYGDKHIAKYSNEISDVINGIETIIQSVQRIASELRPDVLVESGLYKALEWQGDLFQKRTGIKINFTNSVKTLNKIDLNRSITVFRIFQETLTNIMRHAEASRVDVVLDTDEDDQNLILMVRDNGKGINEEEQERNDSVGIIGMQERAEILGGNIKIESAPSVGTTVCLNIPFHLHHNSHVI